jgi:hypothetical protein
MVAMAGLLLLQVPPLRALVCAAALPAHIVERPDMVPTEKGELTVTTFVAVQPPLIE